jgi:cyclopropane fatty-acyl-phospholipid synthase-like methyltransferase
MNYLESNMNFWSHGYNAPNTESYIFRFAGRILSSKFKLPNNHEKMLEFGCGQGANANYLHTIGFNVKGVDISEKDIAIGKIRFPHIKDKLSVCDPSPIDNPYYGWEKDISVVVCAQSIYYFTKDHFNNVLQKIYDAMKPGGIFFATMISHNHTYFEHSEETDDPWLRKVSFKGRRFDLEDYYVFFTKDKKECEEKFSLFEKLYVGEYMMQLEENETNNHHWVYIGQKPQ